MIAFKHFLHSSLTLKNMKIEGRILLQSLTCRFYLWKEVLICIGRKTQNYSEIFQKGALLPIEKFRHRMTWASTTVWYIAKLVPGITPKILNSQFNLSYQQICNNGGVKAGVLGTRLLQKWLLIIDRWRQNVNLLEFILELDEMIKR